MSRYDTHDDYLLRDLRGVGVVVEVCRECGEPGHYECNSCGSKTIVTVDPSGLSDEAKRKYESRKQKDVLQHLL